MEAESEVSPTKEEEGSVCSFEEIQIPESKPSSDYCGAPTSSQSTTLINACSILFELLQILREYVKLLAELYPRRLFVAVVVAVGLLLLNLASPWGITRHPLEGDYTSLSAHYDFRKAEIHHWCLFGGNDNCYCEDPTLDLPREQVRGWSDTHNRNKQQIKDNPLVQHDGKLDVVFVGDGIFQAWGEGRFLDRSFGEGAQIAEYFNQTFRSRGSNYLQGLALGAYTDRATNLLWRLKHGEMPENLRAKVWWISIGSSDIALAMCSEDVTTLGILRVAEEIAFHNPDSKIVIQGILPRSNHADGSLHATTKDNNRRHKHYISATHESPYRNNNIWKFRTQQANGADFDIGHSKTSHAVWQAQQQTQQPHFDYYIWPSIREINRELRGFCNKHSDQFVYFDPDDLFIETVGSDDDPEQRVKKELMHNGIQLSLKGHQVLMDAAKHRLEEILRDFKGWLRYLR